MSFKNNKYFQIYNLVFLNIFFVVDDETVSQNRVVGMLEDNPSFS